MIEIIKAGISHIPGIQEIAYKTWPVTFKNILSENQITYMLKMMYSTSSLKKQMSDKHHFILALEKDAALGFASYEMGYSGQSKTKIHKIYILPTAQGKGAGKAFIAYISNKAVAYGHQSLILNVNRYNTAAINFYHKTGFMKTREETIPIGKGFLMEDYVLEMNL